VDPENTDLFEAAQKLLERPVSALSLLVEDD
jgi:hypothetical protein